jgi:hypothetical protein
MTRKSNIQCNCQARRAATETVMVSVRVMGEYRDEMRAFQMCGPCAEATRANGLAA